MLKELEERIVSMQFNNEQFEKNIQKSTESLKALDKTIEQSAQNINKNMSKLDFSGSSVTNIERSLQQISSRFSTMGIVGMTVIQNLTNAAMNLGKTLWSSTIGQIKAGGMKRALNIEQAEFLLEGLGLDVAQIKDDAMYAVEGTAYGFDEAAKAASSFGASGVKAGEDMKEALLGVSGVAAMTGRDYQSIADIFTTIASNGKLMTMQLRQFSASGLNVSAAMAKYLGKTEAEINDMVTKGQIDFKTFAQAMNETFGEHAKDANKTFNGSMSNMKAALSRIGEAFATPYIENMIPVFNKLKDVINDVKKALGPLIDDSANLMKILSDFAVGALDKLQNSGAIVDIFYGIRHIFLGIVGVLAALSKAIRETFPNVDGLSGLFRNLTLKLVPTRESFEKLVSIFKTVIETIKMVAKVAFGVITAVLKIVPKVVNFIKTAFFVIYAVVTKVIDALSNMVFFNQLFTTIKKIFDSLKLGFFVLLSLLGRLKEGLDTVLADERVQKFFTFVKDVAYKAFSGLLDLIEHLDLMYGGFAATLVTVLFALFAFKKTIQAVAAPVMGVVNALKGFVGIFTSISGFFNAGSSMFQGIRSFIDAMKEAQQRNIAATVVIKLAISIGILAVSLKLLSTIPWNDLLVGMGVVLLLLAGLSVYAKMLNELDAEKKGVKGILALAVGVAILAYATKSLSTLSWDQWAVAAASMGTIITFVLAVQWITSRLKDKMIVAGLWTLSICMNLLAIAYKSLSTLSWDQWAMAAAGMGTILTFVVAMQWITSRLKDKMIVAGLWTLSICTNILAFALKSIGSLSWDQLSIASLGMLVLLGFVASLMGVSKLLNKGSILSRGIDTKGLITLSIAITILTAAFKKLGEMSWDQLAIAAVGLAAIEVFIVTLQLISKHTKGIKTRGLIKIAAVAVALVTVMTILYKITLMPMNDILVAATAIAAVVLALAVTMKMLTGSVFNQTFDLKMILVLAAAVGVLIAISYSLQTVADIPSENIVAASVAIAALFLALGLGLKLMNGSTGWAALLAGSVALVAIAGALYIVASIPADRLIPAALALAAILGAMLIFGAVVAVLPMLGVALLAITAAMIGFSVGALLFAAAIALIAGAFESFTNSLVNLAQLSDESMDQINANLVKFVEGLGAAALAFAAQTPAFAAAISAVFGAIIMALGNVKVQLASTIIDIFIGIVQKLCEAFPLLLEALGDMLMQISEWFETHEEAIEEIGFNIGKGLTRGIIAGMAGASEAIYEVIDDTFVHSANSDDVMEEAAQAQAETYANALTKWFNYYDAGTVTADQLIEGMRLGLENGMYTQEEVMRELAQRGLEGYQDELGIHSPSLEMIENGEYTIAGVIEGIHNGEYTFEQVMAALGKNGASAFMSQFSDITGLMDEINGTAEAHVDYRALGASYENERGYTTSQQRWQREGFKSLDEFVEHYQTAEFESMMDEWLGSTSDTADAEDDLTESTDELTDSLTGPGGYSGAAGTAAKETDKLKDSVKNALDIFSGFDAQLDTTSKDVLRSFSEQLVGVTAWAKELEELATRDIPKELLNSLAEAGPSAIGKIHALYSMTDEQLSLFNKMYEQKLSLEKTTADDIRASFGQLGETAGSEVGEGIAEGTKQGVEQATEYIEQYVDDGKRANDMVIASQEAFDASGGKSGRTKRWYAEGYESAEAWEEAHRKACTKMVPVIKQDYAKISDAASEGMTEGSGATSEAIVSEMEQGVMDAYKIGAEFEYVNGVIIPNSIKESIKEATPSIASIFGEMGYQSMEAFEHMLNVDDALAMVELFQQGLADSITSSLKLFDEVKEKEDISAEEMLKRMKENVKNIGKWANDLQTLAARGVSDGLLAELQALGPEGADKVHAFTKMTEAQLKQANQAFAASAALPQYTADRITKSYAEAGMNTTLGFVEGIDPTAAEEVMTALGTYSLAALKEALDIHSPSGKMMEAGMYTVAGLVQGISDNLGQITTIGAEMGNALLNTITSAPEIVTEKVSTFFNMLSDIFTNGVKKFSESEAIQTFRNSVIDMLNIAVDDISFEPTIRPVLDMSGIDGSVGALNGYFGRGFNVSASISKADNAFGSNKIDYSGYLRDMTNVMKQTRDDVVGIRQDVNRLDSTIAGMSVELDGYSVGRVVTPYVNRNLGQTYINNKRRSM